MKRTMEAFVAINEDDQLVCECRATGRQPMIVTAESLGTLLATVRGMIEAHYSDLLAVHGADAAERFRECVNRNALDRDGDRNMYQPNGGAK